MRGDQIRLPYHKLEGETATTTTSTSAMTLITEQKSALTEVAVATEQMKRKCRNPNAKTPRKKQPVPNNTTTTTSLSPTAVLMVGGDASEDTFMKENQSPSSHGQQRENYQYESYPLANQTKTYSQRNLHFQSSRDPPHCDNVPIILSSGSPKPVLVEDVEMVPSTPLEEDAAPAESLFKVTPAASSLTSQSVASSRSMMRNNDEECDLGDLAEALKHVHLGSTYATGSAWQLPSLPGLCVQGDILPLPLTEFQAQQLACTFGQNPVEEDLLARHDDHDDDNNNKTNPILEIGHEHLTIQNPQWEEALEQVIHAVSGDLGIAQPEKVSARLEKLLVWNSEQDEEEEDLSTLSDTPKSTLSSCAANESGAFATLLVQLPSQFTGGSFTIHSRNGHLRDVTLEKEHAPYVCSYLMYYNECQPIVRPVQSGYALMLQYTLFFDGPRVPRISNMEYLGVHSVLKHFSLEETLFALPLKHSYNKETIEDHGSLCLRGSDQALYEMVEAFNPEAYGWDMMIAQLERTELKGTASMSGMYCSDFDSENDGHTLNNLFHTDGSDASAHMPWIKEPLEESETMDAGYKIVNYGDYDMWHKGKSVSVRGTNRQVGTKTDYHASVLVVYSKDFCYNCWD